MKLFKGKETVLVISDTQYPFHHPDTFKFLAKLKQKYKPTQVVHIGDSVDFNCFSRFLKDPEGLSTLDEYSQGIKALKQQYKLFPKGVEVFSNHVGRLNSKIAEAGIPTSFMKPMEEILAMPKSWSIVKNIVIDGIQYEHGDRAGGINAARILAISNMKSTVIGHHHSNAGVNFIANDDTMIFAANAGCLIDINSYAFKYADKAKFKPTLGTVVVNKGVPKFIPMMLDKKGRWIGELL